MVDTEFANPESKRDRLAAMYGRPDLVDPDQTSKKSLAQRAGGFNERIDVTQTYPVDMAATFQRGGHGLFGTAWDYFRFAQMLANGEKLEGVRILGRKTAELMHLKPSAALAAATRARRARRRRTIASIRLNKL
jgi:CubicO group peptidase (beta-lactamase class C family)